MAITECKTKTELADKILQYKDVSVHEKLFLMSQLYKDELSRSQSMSYLYYAILMWKDEYSRYFAKDETVSHLLDEIEDLLDKISEEED